MFIRDSVQLIYFSHLCIYSLRLIVYADTCGAYGNRDTLKDHMEYRFNFGASREAAIHFRASYNRVIIKTGYVILEKSEGRPRQEIPAECVCGVGLVVSTH